MLNINKRLATAWLLSSIISLSEYSEIMESGTVNAIRINSR